MEEQRRVGRPERPVNPLNGPVSRFAHELRQLRAAAGYPTYRSLARRAMYSASVLSSAASGVSFPTLQVTLAFARACGGKEYTIREGAECGDILDEALRSEGPAVIEAVVDPNEPPMPPKVTAR